MHTCDNRYEFRDTKPESPTKGNKVLFTNEDGKTIIVAVDREFQQLAKNTLEKYVYASVTPVGNQLFIRTTKHLYCIQEDKP